MNNTIHKIAKDNIKKEHQFYKYIFISIFFTFFFIIVSSLLSMSFQKLAYDQSSNIYGQWDAIVVSSSQYENEIKKIRDIRKIGHMYFGGEVINEQLSLGNIGYFDDSGYELSYLHFLEGRKANHKNEIVIEKRIAEMLNLSLKQNVQLKYKVKDKTHTQQFKIVGIVENYIINRQTRGLSFITYQMESYDYDILLESRYTVNLWNDLKRLEYNLSHLKKEISIVYNTSHFPELKEVLIKYDDTFIQGFSNETSLLIKCLEIIFISFIAMMITMLSSLNKRENHFVLYRSIGMTYKQLQKLIIYEGYILAFIAFVFALVLGVLTSFLIMFLYSLIASTPLTLWCTTSVLLIELGICIITLAIGIYIPTLTIYELPLTKKDISTISHAKKRKIRKPTFISLIKQELTSQSFINLFIFILLIIVFIKAISITNLVDIYNNEYQAIAKEKMISNFIYYDIQPIDYKSLLNQKDIHIYADKLATRYTLKWQDMNKEEKEIVSARNEVLGNIVCIENDEELKDYFQTLGIDKIKDGEAIVVKPHYNYNAPIYGENDNEYSAHSYEIDMLKKADGLYSQDIGLKENKTIQIGRIDGTYSSLNMIKVIDLNNELKRDYMNNYTVILNEETYYQTIGDRNDNYIHINVDNHDAKNRVENYFITEIISKHTSYQPQFVDETDKIRQLHSLKTGFISEVTYMSITLIIYIFLIYLVRLLSIFKIKKRLGILRSLGMTKKKAYFIYGMYATIIYVIAIVLVLGSWHCFEVLKIDQYKVREFIIIYIIYMMGMIIPIQNILDQKVLNLIKGE